MEKILFDVLKKEYIDQIFEIEKISLPCSWSKEAFLNDLTKKNTYYVVALIENKVVGYCGLYTVLDEANITNVAVSPMYRNKGTANRIIERIVDYSLKSGMSLITLEVRQSNYKAINLYKKNGFIIVGERKNYYPDNRETAIIMTKYLKEV